MAEIFHPVLDKIKQQNTRTTKVKIFLEFLGDQSEETIKLVMEKLKKKNMYIYRQLFPNIDKYPDIGNGLLYIIFQAYIRVVANTQFLVADPDF